MAESQDKLRARRYLIWTLFVIFVIHGVETIQTIGGWFAAHANKLQLAKRALAVPTVPELALALALEAIVVALACFAGARQADRSPGMTLYLAMVGVVFGTAIVDIGQAIFVRGYAPGLVSAVVLLLPFSILMLVWALKAEWLSPVGLVAAVVVGMVLQWLLRAVSLGVAHSIIG